MTATETTKPRNVWTLSVAGALVLCLLIYTVAFTVPAGTVGVVKTFGAIKRVETVPDIYFKLPWPFQSVQVEDIRLRLLEVPAKEVLAKDKFNILASMSIGWHIEKVDTFLVKLENIEAARDTMINRATTAREAAIKEIRLDDIVTTNPKQRKNFEKLEDAILNTLKSGLNDADFGIAVDFVKIQSIKLSKDVTQKVFDRMTKERERISKNYRSEGERDANTIRQDAEKERSKLLADAEAEAIRLRGQGDAMAAKYYKVFKDNPTLANWLRECDALRESLKNNSTVILPTDHTPFRILKEEAPKVKAGN